LWRKCKTGKVLPTGPQSPSGGCHAAG
jgi:hypothetical protein